MPVPVLPEDELELEELLAFVEGFVELVALESKLVLEPVDPVVEELLPVSVGLFKVVPLEATLGFELADPKNPPPPGLLNPNAVELPVPLDKRDVLEEPVPVDAGLL